MKNGLIGGAVSAIALLAGTAHADEGEDRDNRRLEAVVIVGTRADARTVAESMSPVDLLTGKEVEEAGFNDLSKSLQFLLPAVNYPRSATAFSSTGTRGITLRGLTPDQTLVLVNGKRRHASSVLNTNNSIGRGTVPVDLNTIPAPGIKRIEVLRDGSASQYGSDAIGGVLNVVLRDDAEGARGSVQYGQTERGDGQTVIASLSKGFAIGEDGNLTLTGEYRDRAFTNSAEIDPRFGRITQKVGDPNQQDLNLVADWTLPVGDGAEIYGFATFASRDSLTNPLFRTPSVAPTVYPNGFLPEIAIEVEDSGGALGYTQEYGDWVWDLSDTYGYSAADFSAAKTVNTSLISVQTPIQTSFYSGGARYFQNVLNLTGTRKFDILSGVNLALGGEHRHENYKLLAGEPNSYEGAGAAGLPGFSPSGPIDEGRDGVSLFADLEAGITDALTISGAVRYEDYSDFGSQTTWKVSGRWQIVDLLALRATASTGFRAPSLQQQHFSSITSQLDTTTQELVLVGTFAVEDPVSLALGASPLTAEVSTNYSAGLVFEPADNFFVTADYFRIEIDDRISLSESLAGPAVRDILAANGITNASQVRFFTNAADTVTEGWEVAGSWQTDLAGNDLALRLGYGQFDNRLSQLKQNPVLPALPLLNFASLGILLDAQIESKFTAAATLSRDRWQLSINAAHFGPWELPTGQEFGEETLVDVSLAVDLTETIRVQAGILNAVDNYPDEVVPNLDGRPYSEGGGLGGDGREYYARLSIKF